MKILFFGSSHFSIPVLKALSASRHSIVQVVTTRDQKKGRGQKMAASVVKHFALDNKLPVVSPEKLAQPKTVENIKALGPDFMVIASYGKMVPASVFSAAKIAALNVHPSLLPKYRGASPIHAALLAGEEKTGLSIAEVTSQLDAGDLFAQVEIDIGEDENALDLSGRLAKLGAETLLDLMDRFEQGNVIKKPQDHSKMTYAPKLERDSGRINWAMSADDIHNQVRAYYPWPSAFTIFRGKRLKILRTLRAQESGKNMHPGTIVFDEGGNPLCVQTQTEPLAIVQVQLEGRREMGALEFARGQRIQNGERFE